MNTRPITVAWVVPTREPVDPLSHLSPHLDPQTRWRDIHKAGACLWARDGSEDDLKAAQAYAANPDPPGYPTVAVQWEHGFSDDAELMQRAREHALETLVPKPEPEPVQQKPAPKRKKG